MTIAPRLKTYLYSARIDFDLVPHPHAPTTLEAARKANVPAHATAKSVLVTHVDGHAMAVVPSDRKVNLTAMQDYLHYRLGLAPEDDLGEIFPDCELGAVPPMGTLYGVKTLVDHELGEADSVFFEAGDHETFVKVSQRGFARLMRDVEHVDLACSGHA